MLTLFLVACIEFPNPEDPPGQPSADPAAQGTVTLEDATVALELERATLQELPDGLELLTLEMEASLTTASVVVMDVEGLTADRYAIGPVEEGSTLGTYVLVGGMFDGRAGAWAPDVEDAELEQGEVVVELLDDTMVEVSFTAHLLDEAGGATGLETLTGHFGPVPYERVVE